MNRSLRPVSHIAALRNCLTGGTWDALNGQKRGAVYASMLRTIDHEASDVTSYVEEDRRSTSGLAGHLPWHLAATRLRCRPRFGATRWNQMVGRQSQT
ncbi:MAG: hypothetical protein DMF87_23985 [Acidobacteria bacterium]|nr:MAG: hypothetical protein DMF87_23985 [Acidobacteriota bacterium]